MIDIFFNNLRKMLVLSLALMFTFAVVYIPQEYNHHKTVESAQAIFGVDIPNLVQNTISAVVSVAIKLKEFILDGLAWHIAKAIVSRLVASLVDWINSGFKGSPTFVTDFGRILLDVADQEAGRFIESLGEIGSFICSPFKLDIQVALSLKYQSGRDDEQPYEGCTLSGVIDNIEGFLDGNFKEGGWKDWINITSQAEKYTPYGQMLEAQAGLQAKLVNAKGQKLTEINVGQGFLSGRVCELFEKPTGGKKEKCTVSKPGTTIANSLNKSLGAGQDALIAADEIDEIIGALIGQLANKAITGAAGLLGLSVGTGHTYSGYSGGSYTSGVGAESSNSYGGGSSGNQGMLTMMTAALNTQQDYKSLADSSIPLIQAYVANTKNPADKRANAQQALNQALEVQQKAPGYITSLTSIIDTYTALETERKNAATSADRKTEIDQLESAVITKFAGLGVYPQEALDASYIGWKISNF